jgi:hypothetical protein
MPFYATTTLQEAIERLLTDDSARKGVIRLTVSGAESGTNSHGSAMLVHDADGVRPLLVREADHEYHR